MEIAALQDVIERTYGERDRARGASATVAWLCEEVGELAQAVRKGTPDAAGARVRRRRSPGSPPWPTRWASTSTPPSSATPPAARAAARSLRLP